MGRPKSHTCALNTLGLIYCSVACSVNRSELDITRGAGAEEVDPPTRCTDHHDGPVSSSLVASTTSARKVPINQQKHIRIALPVEGSPGSPQWSRSLAHSNRPENEALNHRHFTSHPQRTTSQYFPNQTTEVRVRVSNFSNKLCSARTLSPPSDVLQSNVCGPSLTSCSYLRREAASVTLA